MAKPVYERPQAVIIFHITKFAAVLNKFSAQRLNKLSSVEVCKTSLQFGSLIAAVFLFAKPGSHASIEKFENISLWVCLSCTLHSAVSHSGRLLQQPYIASIGVTTRASQAKHREFSVTEDYDDNFIETFIHFDSEYEPFLSDLNPFKDSTTERKEIPLFH